MNPIILYENLLENGNLTASNTASGYDVDNLIDRRSYTKWKASGVSTQTIEVNLLNAKKVSAIGIYKHNLIGATVTLNCYIAAQWEEVISFSPSNNKAILRLTDVTRIATHWQIVISSAVAAPEIGIIMIGNKLEFPFTPTTPYTPSEEGIVVSSLINKNGHTLGNDISYFHVNTQITFTDLLRSWIETYFEPFYHNYGKKLAPFFYAWDLTSAPNHILFATLSPDMVYSTPLKISNYVENLNLILKALNEDY